MASLIIERILSRIRLGGPEGDCWEYTGSRNKAGYGSIAVGNRRTALVHRFLFIFIHGYEPPMVRHRCDNPPCCNPSHLLPGDALSNMDDCRARRRKLKVEKILEKMRG